jgi:hypothetical protein
MWTKQQGIHLRAAIGELPVKLGIVSIQPRDIRERRRERR